MTNEIELLVIGPSESKAVTQVIDNLKFDPEVRVVFTTDIHFGMPNPDISKKLSDCAKVYIGLSSGNLIPLQALEMMEVESKQDLSRQEYFDFVDKINRKKGRRKY